MVKAFRPSGKKPGGKSKKVTKSSQENTVLRQVHIDAVDHEGAGVARHHSPVAFVSGALPDETCQVQVTEQKKNFIKGKVLTVEKAHPDRQDAFCEYFGQCGGCQTQYLDHLAMLDMKQQAVDGLLAKLSGQRETDANQRNWQPALTGSGTGYRRKTRLAIDFRRSNDLRLGFREQGSSDVISVNHCAILQPKLNALLQPLQDLVKTLQNPGSIGHIELLIGDDLPDSAAPHAQPLIVLRTVKTLPVSDKNQLSAFGNAHHCALALEIRQSEYEILTGEAAQIHYHLVDGSRLRALPNDFIQVNPEINRHMIAQAAEWLSVSPQDNILDLFCGIGNFSLSLAKVAAQVVGLEGMSEMVQRAKHNAQLNNIENAKFHCQDLSLSDALTKWRKTGINKVLLDPARTGAKALMPQIMELNPEKVLYVSCNPATFGRDIAHFSGTELGRESGRESANKALTDKAIAVRELAGKSQKQAKPKARVAYKLEKIALLDMFPYTAHTELMALFVRQ